jgi:hypothetical protein
MIIPIPFLFYKYGAKIRAKSTMIRAMREIENRNQRQREKAEQRLKDAQASGNPTAEKFARSELTRVKSHQAYGIPEERDRDVEREADAELTRVEGLTPGDLEKDIGVKMSRA